MTAPTGAQLIWDTRQAGQAAGSLDGVPEQCLIPGL